MLPFIYIGHWRFGTYGICLVTGFFVGYYLLRAELGRRGLRTVNPLVIVFSLGIGALIFSKLYWTAQNYRLGPVAVLLSSSSGFTFYGGLLGDVLAVGVLARYYGVPSLVLCDALSPACALGYGIGRIGCFFAGDGDYGIATQLPWGMSFPQGLLPTSVRVHPAPLYEFITSAAIAAVLWRLGSNSIRQRARAGEVFAWFLVATGVARFLVEFIKRNPRVLWGLGNAQIVGLASVVIGLTLLCFIKLPAVRSTAAPPCVDQKTQTQLT